ncbi:MAG: hypothetical protein IT423_00350 [Pirellulaceae bacterium]|nr:hypothetical protein [Pirellulaceae bacterium]
MKTPTNPPTPSARKQFPAWLIIMLCLYGVWLLGLAYIAWVNVRAGNQ